VEERYGAPGPKGREISRFRERRLLDAKGGTKMRTLRRFRLVLCCVAFVLMAAMAGGNGVKGGECIIATYGGDQGRLQRNYCANCNVYVYICGGVQIGCGYSSIISCGPPGFDDVDGNGDGE
jgi:hypothetical protein